MRRVAPLHLMALLFALSIANAPPARSADKAAAPPKPASPGTVLAEVNGTKITKLDYDRALVAFQKNVDRMTGNRGSPVPDAVKKDFLNQLIGRELIYQQGLKSAPKDLKAKVDEQIKAIKAGYPKPEAFQERLKSQGVTEKEFREVVTKEVVVGNYVETKIAPTVKVTEADAKKFFEANKAKMLEPEQVKASHVLIMVPQGATPEDKEKALKRAKDIQKRAAKGEDFAKLASENSQDPGSAKSGGDLGFFSQDRMVAPFAKAAFALKVGQVSEVVETTYGFHIIKVTDRKAQRQQTYDDVKDKLLPFLKNQGIANALMAKMEELRKTAKVKVLVPNP